MNFDIIYADPAWRYDFSKKTVDSIEEHYPTMATEEICCLDIPSSPDSVLFLWATAPKLVEALDVMRSWGFQYKTNMVWDKVRIGLGFWSRVQHEHLLIGTKGRFSPPDYQYRVSSVYREKKTRHSKKPDYIRNMIANAYSQCSKLELFGRELHEGWVTLGNEVGGEDIKESLRKLREL